ncbi:Zinc finger protein 814-like [Homarus americanus]|uniref:Zinc finger protein 814-like n=1 Tax=Homarus americanus TaxID=6706 RepID=A0A8J5JHL0_HOMAM|nr:Zinc finger protein 814-like [Homarus americanus]
MGYLACPVCERESLVNVSDLQLRVATALTRPLACPICSASVSGLQAFHHHLAAHLPAHHNSCSDAGTPTASLSAPIYPPTSSPEVIPTLEHLEINDGRTSPHSPASLTRALSESRESTVERILGVATSSSEKMQPETSPTHISDHTPPQPHNCDLCGLVFSSEHFLKIHKDIIHAKSNFFDVTCKLCKKKFKDFETYRNHVREDHSDRRYMCDQCPKTFKMKGSLLVHTRMFHDPSSPATCHVCKKTFTTKARKELHEKRYHSAGTDRLPPGKTSPPSPSTKQQRIKNSSLGDAKNWLETLMSENKTVEDCGGPREAFSQQHQPLPSPLQYSPTQTVKQQPDHCVTAEHQFINLQQSQHQNTEQLQIKEHLQQQTRHMQHTQLDAQQLSKLPTKESQDQNSWGQDPQPYINPQIKSPTQPQKSPSDVYFPSYKNNTVFPCQMLQQNFGVGRPRLEYSDFKEEKKVMVPPHVSATEAAASRMVSGGHSQSSPVAVVSPQPHKAETPPASVHAQDAGHAHTEARRNSFPLVNFNKLGFPQGDSGRLHPTNYISELTLAGPEGVPLPSGQTLGLPGLEEKIHNTLAVSQHLVYQHCQNTMVPSISPNMALLGTDSKTGLRVPPLIIPTNLYPTEKLKESPDSPVQMMEVQKEAVACEIRPMMEGGEALEGLQDPRREQQGRPQRPPGPSPTTNALPKKESGGKADNKQWECEVCKKSFTTKYFLKKHKRLHTESVLLNQATLKRGILLDCVAAFWVSLRSHKCEPNIATTSGGSSTPTRKDGDNRVDACKNLNTGTSGTPPPTPAAASTPPHFAHTPTTTPQTTVGVVSPNCGGVVSRDGESPLLVGGGAGEADPPGVPTPPHHQQQQQINNSRMKMPLETIDLAAISCESVGSQHDGGKRSPHKSRSSSHAPKISSSNSGGSQDPLSMAFLHALVDPQQVRLQGECRPHAPLPQDTLPFPSLSPGAMDADMDHDSFLTNLLM